MKKSAIVMLALVVCIALCAQEAYAWRWLKPVWVAPAPGGTLKEEVAKCKAAVDFATERKPCLDEIASSARNGTRGIEAITGPLCCKFFLGVEDNCLYHYLPQKYQSLLEPNVVKHCPKP